ncbi:MAG TPA: glutathionylspermidine synthase family protein [Chloroflexota bacterium]|nr:glutathionylspermidine synthase family protein [Chloroflexota bacterium]
MRALITTPGDYAPVAFRRFVRSVQVEGLFPDHLVRGEPYLALNAVILPSDAIARLRLLTEAFTGIFDRAGRQFLTDPANLVELGFPWTAAELLIAEEPRIPLVARFDFVLDQAGGWWLLENNADTPSGIREASVADAAVARLVPAARGLDRLNQRLPVALREAFAAALGDLPSGARLGLVTSVDELEDLAQMAYTRRLLAGPLAERKLAVTLGDLENLRPMRGGLTLCGQDLAAVYRYVPLEFMLGTSSFAALYDAVLAGRVRLLNGLFGLLLQNKGLLAWIWEHRESPLFSEDEKAVIARHLPPTWLIDRVPADEDRANLVVKQVFGREGAEVFFGEDLGDEDWGRLRARHTYVVQRRVDLQTFRCVVPTSIGPEEFDGRATVGGYAVAGRCAGFYTRVGGKVITNRAKWFATFGEK